MDEILTLVISKSLTHCTGLFFEAIEVRFSKGIAVNFSKELPSVLGFLRVGSHLKAKELPQFVRRIIDKMPDEETHSMWHLRDGPWVGS